MTRCRGCPRSSCLTHSHPLSFTKKAKTSWIFGRYQTGRDACLEKNTEEKGRAPPLLLQQEIPGPNKEGIAGGRGKQRGCGCPPSNPLCLCCQQSWPTVLPRAGRQGWAPQFHPGLVLALPGSGPPRAAPGAPQAELHGKEPPRRAAPPSRTDFGLIPHPAVTAEGQAQAQPLRTRGHTA